MADSNGAQLLVEGAQDVWLTVEPQMSFFRSAYKRHVPFAMSLERLRVDPGGLVRFDTAKGDLLGYVYLTVHDPVTDALIPGSVPFTSVSTRVGEQVIDKRDSVYMNTIRRVLESTTENQRQVPTGFQPIWLPFTGTYFPLVALRYTRLDLVIEGLSGAYTYKAWAEMIHLSYDERRWFETYPQQICVQQVRRTVPIQGELCLSGPVKYIAWPTSNYPTTYILQLRPVLSFTGTQLIGTASANTIFIPQTTSFYGLVTPTYTAPGLPTGVTISAQAENGVTLSFAQNTSFDIQNLTVVAQTPYWSTPLTFQCAASVIISRFTVTYVDTTAYLINLTQNPSIFVQRGSLVVFSVDAVGHPFNIQTVSGAYSPGDLYTDGITNPGIDSGTIYWRVPQSAPSTLYYASTYDTLMVGTIFVIN